MEQHVTPAAGEPAGIASPARLAHVVLRTTQYDAVVAWYKLVLGARVQFEASGKISFLTYDDEHHRIAVVNVPTLADRPPMAIGVDHIAFTYNSMCDLVDTYERLKAASVRPYWTINHGPTISFYYRDPDNNQIELQVDNFATNDDVNEFWRLSFQRTRLVWNLIPMSSCACFATVYPKPNSASVPISGRSIFSRLVVRCESTVRSCTCSALPSGDCYEWKRDLAL